MANSTALSGSSRIQISIDNQKLDAAKLNAVLDKFKINVGIDWKFGASGNDYVNLLYHATLTAQDDAPSAVDISGSDIKDAFGDDCDFSLLKLLYVKNTDATEDLLIGGLANQVPVAKSTTPFAEFGVIVIPPGGYLLWADPVGVNVTADKYLQIWAETVEITYDIVLMGIKTP